MNSKNDFFAKINNMKLKGITNNSKKIDDNFIFVAVKGCKTDGHNYIEEAIKKGASVVVLEYLELKNKLENKYPDVKFFLVKDTRKVLAQLSKWFYKKPDEEINIIGITGTNGKTTVSNLIAQYLEFSGKKTGIIGTLGYLINNKLIGEGRTTPDAIEWYKILRLFADAEAEYVVAEISSHALDQDRVYGTRFKGAVFTNLSSEHLDYHKNMENYFNAKLKLFRNISKDASIIVNIDDKYGRIIAETFKDRKIFTYGQSSEAKLRIIDPKITQDGISFLFQWNNKHYKVVSGMLGEFNIYNLAASIGAILSLGFDPEFVVEKCSSLKPVKGRFQKVYSGKFTVIVDYAHTPEGLKSILTSIRNFSKGKIITVFGAGGDRDRLKRPLMGKYASELSDVVILTSDNPRSENPINIIDDIKKGIKLKTKVIIEPDREGAIKTAINMAEDKDVVLIAGKGHETYQIIKNKTIHFDDVLIANKYVEKKLKDELNSKS